MSGAGNTAAARDRLGGLLLVAAAVAALAFANSPLARSYDALLHLPVLPSIGGAKPLDLAHFTADALMAVFFLLVGLEVKREWYWGRLSKAADRRLPILAAAGGMAIPALVYALTDWGDSAHLRGWAIPAATDIAFAVGVLGLLGNRVPTAIKLLLVSIAVVDDVGAVIIIALVYTASLNVTAMGWALAVLAALGILNQMGVRRLWPYLIGFAIMWWLILQSGVHATIAGVLAALAVPLGEDRETSPLRKLEHSIHPWVMLGIVPLFGFTSAGVSLAGGVGALFEPIALGVTLGLALGKPLGVMGAIIAAVRTGLVPRPSVGWTQLWGAAALTGIGFTMSLFIGALAFPDEASAIASAKLGTLAGSLIAALVGTALLIFAERDGGPDEADDLFASGN